MTKRSMFALGACASTFALLISLGTSRAEPQPGGTGSAAGSATPADATPAPQPDAGTPDAGTPDAGTPALGTPPVDSGGTTEALPSSTDEIAERLSAAQRVPDNPTLDLLGAEDLKVSRPSDLSDLATQLRGLYKDGKVVPQVAVEFSPYDLIAGGSLTFDDYKHNRLYRMLHRLTLSIATSSTGDGDNQIMFGAIGARVRIYDGSDWRMNDAAIDCALKAAPLPAPPDPAPDQPGVVVGPPPDETAKQAVAKCFEEHAAKWNANQLALGAALSSAFPGGELQWDINDGAAWISGAVGYGEHTQFVLGGKYLFNDTRKDGDDRLPTKHTLAVSGQFERRADKYGFILTAGAGTQLSRDTATASWSRDTVGLLGAEIQIAVSDDVWLSLHFAAQIVGTDHGTLLSLANFNWGYDVGPKDKN
jgi:hypothetical protein